jgi:hypothetical protein
MYPSESPQTIGQRCSHPNFGRHTVLTSCSQRFKHIAPSARSFRRIFTTNGPTSSN